MASAESAALADQKRALRRAMGEMRSRLSPDERARASERLSARLSALTEVRAAGRGACVAGFVAVRGEIDPAGALADARRAGATVALPRVTGADDETRSPAGATRMRLHRAADGEGDRLRPGRFGIPEPDASSPALEAADVTVMLVPGLAFDARGNRLGFGGGYYDEWLTASGARRPALVVGVGYDFQIVDVCPATEGDARVDCVVTDARVIRCVDGGGDAGSPPWPVSTSFDDGKVNP